MYSSKRNNAYQSTYLYHINIPETFKRLLFTYSSRSNNHSGKKKPTHTLTHRIGQCATKYKITVLQSTAH